jgi:hypothetical protein
VTTSRFGITYDYLCPFARNANEHVVTALRAGAPWEVDFRPFSLAQAKVDEGEPALWRRGDVLTHSGVLALTAAEVVRSVAPDRFLAVHLELFALRHDHGGDLRDAEQVARALGRGGVDASLVLEGASDGLAAVAASHSRLVEEHEVWGVPTFIGSQRSVFVRILDRPDGDGEVARRRIERVLELLEDEPQLHEFKQVDLPR